jgi:hypothetical protein
MPAFRVNGGIINSQTLTGSLRYFKMTGPFSWTMSDGSVNLPVSVPGGVPPSPAVTTYFVVGPDKPVPHSAAEWALQEISKQCDIVIIGLYPVPATESPVIGYGDTTEIHFACSASAFGWGSDTPPYSVPPADQPEDLTAAAPQMQAAVNALGVKTVWVSVGAPDQTATPVTANVDLSTVIIVEVPFALV